VGALILDASVLIGLLDRADAHHERAVDDVAAADVVGDELLTPASAYSEALVAFARAGRVDDAREAIQGMGIVVHPVSAEIAEHAAKLRARHDRLRLPDAIVLASAHGLNARLLAYDDRLTALARRRARS
jgi:predicted nucleic acid-binding protein